MLYGYYGQREVSSEKRTEKTCQGKSTVIIFTAIFTGLQSDRKNMGKYETLSL